VLAHLQIARGKTAEARISIQKAEAFYREGEFHPIFCHALQRAQVRLWIAEQNVPALEAFARKIMPLTEQEYTFRVEAPLIELCQTWIALGRSEQAAILLNRLVALTGDRNGRRLEILLLLTVAESTRPDLAQANLEQALRLGEPEGYLRTFIEAGERVRQVLNIWRQHPAPGIPASLRSYAGLIYSAFDPPSSKNRQSGDLPEPLTQRELDVLHLLMEGLSNRQIAERLFLSEGTVKFYVHNILQKLGVESRSQAIAQAKTLKLVAD
jgi:LuxR family maltose regulon positive regulatory protein